MSGISAMPAQWVKGAKVPPQHPGHSATRAIQASDVIITMGCGHSRLLFPGKRYEDWNVDDPAGQDLDTVRTIRDDIRARVEHLLTRLPTEH